jgi:hypothetical protein
MIVRRVFDDMYNKWLAIAFSLFSSLCSIYTPNLLLVRSIHLQLTLTRPRNRRQLTFKDLRL